MANDQINFTVTFKTPEKNRGYYQATRDVLEKITRDFANNEHFGVYDVITQEGSRPAMLALRFADVLYIG